jgi:hypothetical protein
MMDESGDGYDLTRVLDASGGDPTICLLFACLRSGISVTLTPSHTQGIVTGRSHSQGDHTHREITLTGRSHSQRFSEDFWTPFLKCAGETICLFHWVFWICGVGRNLFLVDFGPCFRPYFTAPKNTSIDSAVQKFLP